jgi:hypothetical protein
MILYRGVGEVKYQNIGVVDDRNRTHCRYAV